MASGFGTCWSLRSEAGSPGAKQWKYERQSNGFATSARSCAAAAWCAWSAPTRSTSRGRG